MTQAAGGTDLSGVHCTSGEWLKGGEVSVLPLHCLPRGRAIVDTLHDLWPHERALRDDPLHTHQAAQQVSRQRAWGHMLGAKAVHHRGHVTPTHSVMEGLTSLQTQHETPQIVCRKHHRLSGHTP